MWEMTIRSKFADTSSSSDIFDVIVFFFSILDSCPITNIIKTNIITGSGVMTIFI